MSVFGCLIVLFLLFLYLWKNERPRGFPPGPWRLPLLGNLLYFSKKDPLKELDQVRKKYGPVFSLYFGRTPVVFTHGFPSAKEVLVTKGTEFAGRAEIPIIDAITNKKGILTLRYGEIWKEQRRFSLMLLRNFGMGKKSMEEKILEEASYLIQVFMENISMPFDPYEFVNTAVINIISTILFGKRFEYDNSFLTTLLDEIHRGSKVTAGPWGLLYNEMPLLRSLPLPHQTVLATAKKVDVFIKKEVEEHKATMIPGEPRDFADAYLEEMQKPEKNGSSFEEGQLEILLSDQLVAGTETTSATLQWGFLYLVAFPEIQEKCWKEIDTVLGNKASLKYKDREKLPYTNAVIHEIQRVSNVVPLGLPHAPIKDVQLFGYKIPKDTTVFVNIQSAHRDESQWKFPNEFNPSNFLNEEGEFVKPEAFLAFSAGPRVCIGENLARMELFLFFTNILRNFQLSWPDKSQTPDFTPHFAVTQSPSHFKVLLKCRQPCE
ncbi:cytochrome P450 2J2-like [Pantherophis guttatus]|uniref:Cytochrome P450 2J2-like n=1 Tax=Pantherophis guttatus TaxID=94885 RepID=A0A6P9CDD6_PANGU|nr:cytochrome P450 2J2-like [Pantherophis guttatus]